LTTRRAADLLALHRTRHPSAIDAGRILNPVFLGSPPSPPTTTRERLLRTAAELFLRDGFTPVGLDRIIAAVGVTKTTFYKHFPSKDDLIIAVLAHQHEFEMGNLASEVERRAPNDPRGQVLAMFDVFDEWFNESDFRGCMFLNAATEFPMRTDPIHVAALAHGAGLGEFIATRLTTAGCAAPVADVLGAQIVLLISGAVVTRHTAGNPDAAKLARPIVEALLDLSLR